MLAERISALLQRGGPPVRRRGARRRGDPDADPLAVPLEEEFRVGTMGLGWDADSRSIVVELLAVSEEEVDESVVLDDTEEGPDALRVFLSPAQARAFAERAEKVVSAGRPPCPLCAEPLDPEGHVCIRLNGYHQRTPSRSDHGSPWIFATRPCRSCCAPGGWRSPAGSSTPRTRRCSARSRATASSCAASTSRCAASARCGTSRTARSPGARSRAYLVSEAGGLARRAADGAARRPFGPGMVQVWVDTDDERELVDVCAPDEVPAGWLRVLRARGGRGEPARAGARGRPELRGDGRVRRAW